jgi:hypothetical protein
MCQGFMAFRIVRFAKAMRMTHGKWTGVFVVVLTVVLVLLLLVGFASAIMVPVYLYNAVT